MATVRFLYTTTLGHLEEPKGERLCGWDVTVGMGSL